MAMNATRGFWVAWLLAVIAGCAFLPATAGKAPQPLLPVEVARLYVGRWYEIARTPMRITHDCVGGTTDYYRTVNGALFDRDACRMGSPAGREKVFSGPVTILDPGENAKIRVGYVVWRVFRVPRTYWILDHDTTYRWFILSDPSFEHISVFTRAPRPPPAELRQLVAKAQALGYDTSKLEYPQELASGDD